MEVFRIVPEAFSRSLEASGAPNRWNLRGQKVIYAGSSRSLSTLELIVHRSSIQINKPYKLLVIHIENLTNHLESIKLEDLPPNWRSIQTYGILQNLGSKWYQEQKSLILEVPSAVIPQETNFILNTEHPLFRSEIYISNREDFFWDNRLL